MTTRADAPDWTHSEEPLRMRLNGPLDFSAMTDEQLLDERDAQRRQLNELVVNPDSSPAVEQVRSTIEAELDDLSIELTRRGLVAGRPTRRTRRRLRVKP